MLWVRETRAAESTGDFSSHSERRVTCAVSLCPGLRRRRRPWALPATPEATLASAFQTPSTHGASPSSMCSHGFAWEEAVGASCRSARKVSGTRGTGRRRARPLALWPYSAFTLRIRRRPAHGARPVSDNLGRHPQAFLQRSPRGRWVQNPRAGHPAGHAGGAAGRAGRTWWGASRS